PRPSPPEEERGIARLGERRPSFQAAARKMRCALAAALCRFSNSPRPVPARVLGAVLVASSSLAFRAETAAADRSPNSFAATNGNDAWSGRLAGPNRGHSDGPFATLKKAIESARAVQAPEASA